MHGNHRLSAGAVALALAATASACKRDRAQAAPGDTTPTAAADPCTLGATPMITAGGVGPIRLGARPADLARCPTRDTVIALEGTRESARVVGLGGSAVVALLGRDSTVSRIIVRDGALRTERSIGVGSTVGNIRQAYGRLCAAVGEGRVVVSAAGLSGISFETSTLPSRLPRGGRTVERDPGLVPDSSTITTIWVYDGESLCGGS